MGDPRAQLDGIHSEETFKIHRKIYGMSHLLIVQIFDSKAKFILHREKQIVIYHVKKFVRKSQ